MPRQWASINAIDRATAQQTGAKLQKLQKPMVAALGNGNLTRTSFATLFKFIYNGHIHYVLLHVRQAQILGNNEQQLPL